MTHFKKIVVAGLFLFVVTTLNAFAQSFPLRYAGELNVCEKVSADMKEGKSLESALVNFFLSYSDQPTQGYRSIQQGIIHAAIKECHYDGAEVIRAVLRIDMNLPLLVLSMSDAGVNLEMLKDALQQAGLSRATIDEAFEVARVENQIPAPGYIFVLPPPFEIVGGGGGSGSAGSGGGLGQASPFIP